MFVSYQQSVTEPQILGLAEDMKSTTFCETRHILITYEILSHVKSSQVSVLKNMTDRDKETRRAREGEREGERDR